MTAASNNSPVNAPAPAPVPAPASGPAVSGFQIETDLVMDAAFEPAFQAAAARWQSIVTGDLSDESTDGLDPPRPGCTHPAMVDDLYICGILEPIDGEGNQVGFARPLYLRPDDSSLPFTGEMVFDSVDMAGLQQDGLLGDLILHEMCESTFSPRPINKCAFHPDAGYSYAEAHLSLAYKFQVTFSALVRFGLILTCKTKMIVLAPI